MDKISHTFLYVYKDIRDFVLAGLRCFHCEDLRDTSLCTVIDVCSDADQVCVTVKDLNDNYQISYRLGCVKKEVCGGQVMALFRHSCCSSDYCNAYNLDDATTASKQISSSTVKNMLTNGEATTTIRTEATPIRTEATTTPNHVTLQITTSYPFNCSGHSYYQWHGQCYYMTHHSTPWGEHRNGKHQVYFIYVHVS
ncbi:unnamed protein product [Mytilus coruscus]|uniref:Snake toxin/toxin-like domain-containing protein n=1 Tax=Mytilus coruscus TaxID=42192 RepID=A0A6J8ANH5_MYTCO|nr:unnamed protein product [Mytilus coruscus]